MNDEETREGAAVRFPPPIVPLLGLAAGFALEWVVSPIPDPFVGVWRFVVGANCTAAGLALMLIAIGLFRTTGQDPKPWKSSPSLIATGIYKWTRNPMYLGMGLLQAGIGVLLANMWVVVLVPGTWLIIYFIAIRHEESYLDQQFGGAYLDYKNQVRRWL